MGKKAGRSNGAVKEKKQSGGSCKYCLAFLMLLVAAFLALPGRSMMIGDALLLVFVTLKYHEEGLPMDYAWRDVLYMSSLVGRSPLFLPYHREMDGIYERELLQVAPGDDHMTALCKVSMYTQMVTNAWYEGTNPFMPPGWFNLDTFDPGSTQNRVNSYLQACKEVYASLDKEGNQRKILDRLQPVRKLEHSLPINPPTSIEKMTEARAGRYRIADSLPSHSSKWKKAEDIPEYGFMYERTKIRPVKEEWIDASEIPKAVEQGKVAVFDATKLLGKEIFNKTMPEIAAMHGDLAKGIPMYRQKGATAPGRSGIESLESYARRVKVWKASNQIRYPENAPWRPAGFVTPQDGKDMADGRRQSTWWLEKLADVMNIFFLPALQTDIRDLTRMMRSHALQCAVNTRRLPKLPMPKIEDALGNPDWLERAWSMFWLGPVADCWHYDDPDNLLIGIYGEIWVTVFQLKDREVLRAAADRGCWSPMAPMPQRIDTPQIPHTDSWLEKFEFIHLKLTPGTGVVVPSGAFHSLTMTDGDRILLNCFMIPKYKGLWNVPAANYSFYSSKWQTEDYHALSQLKKSSIFRLWDTKKLGGYFEGSKLEML